MTRTLLVLLTIAALYAVGCAKKYPMVFGSGSFSAACRIVDPPEPCTKELMEKQRLEDLAARCAQLDLGPIPEECVPKIKSITVCTKDGCQVLENSSWKENK